MRYVLEGSFQTTPERVRVTAQLIDATTGAHVWGDGYDRPFEDLLTIQTEVAETIAGTLGAIQGGRGALRKPELERASKEEKLAALTAYDYFLRGIMYIDKFTPEDNLKARELFEKAIELKPNYGGPTASWQSHITSSRSSAGAPRPSSRYSDAWRWRKPGSGWTSPTPGPIGG